MPTIPFVQSNQIKQFPASDVFGANFGALNKNVMVERDNNSGGFVLTQRPAIWHQTDASASGISNGRAIYEPRTVSSARMYVADTTIYKDDALSTTITGSLQTSAGISRKLPVFFEYLDLKVCIADPSTATGKPLYTVNSPYTALVQETDADIPNGICTGIAQLDGYLFLCGINGELYNSNLDDPQTWNALDFIKAERTTGDFALRIERHKDNIVVWKDNGMEFFYNAANPTGSPLKRREDLFYNIGGFRSTARGDYSQTQIRGAIFFVGVDTNETPGVYVLDNFQLRKISDHYTDQILKRWQTNRYIIGSSLEYLGRSFYVLTMTDTSADPQESIVIDTETGYLAQWTSNLTGFGTNALPIVPGSISANNSTGNTGFVQDYMLMNADVIGIGNNFYGADLTTGVVAADIDIEIRTDVNDFGTTRRKFCGSIGVLGYDYEQVASQSLSVQHSDDNQNTYSTARTISLDPTGNQRIHACGSFRRRSWKLSGSLSERVWLQGIEANISA